MAWKRSSVRSPTRSTRIISTAHPFKFCRVKSLADSISAGLVTSGLDFTSKQCERHWALGL